jgi:hypothetical protein
LQKPEFAYLYHIKIRIAASFKNNYRPLYWKIHGKDSRQNKNFDNEKNCHNNYEFPIKQSTPKNNGNDIMRVLVPNPHQLFKWKFAFNKSSATVFPRLFLLAHGAHREAPG